MFAVDTQSIPYKRATGALEVVTAEPSTSYKQSPATSLDQLYTTAWPRISVTPVTDYGSTSREASSPSFGSSGRYSAMATWAGRRWRRRVTRSAR